MTIARYHGQFIIKGICALFLLFALFLPFNFLMAQAQNDLECLPTDSAIECAQKTLDKGARNSGAVSENAQDSPPTTAAIIGEFVVIGLQIVGLVFFLLTVYGGIVWLTAGGNKERADKAIRTLRQATLGLLVIIFAYLVVNFVVFQLAGIANPPSQSQNP
ncbi:MAG: hypothetical protein Q8P32_00680 [Candidatus Komeilibacteria bacterium]|nr:hypothetical protein [Candidatus Komeilibacteria bacterium]